MKPIELNVDVTVCVARSRMGVSLSDETKRAREGENEAEVERGRTRTRTHHDEDDRVGRKLEVAQADPGRPLALGLDERNPRLKKEERHGKDAGRDGGPGATHGREAVRLE